MGSLIGSLCLMAIFTHSTPTATGQSKTAGGICSFQTAMAVGVRYTLTVLVFGMSPA